ncbi:MAG: tetratricopeptide repeat protein [Anaerolineales bacterium]
MASGKYDVGLASLQQAVSKKSENLLLLHALAEAYQTADLLGKATDTARSALKLAPRDLKNILWYANFKSRSNEPEDAVKALKEALQIDPDRSELKLWLAKSLITAGSLEESHQTLIDLIQNSISEPDILHQAAYTSVHLNDLSMALDALNKANEQMNHNDPTLLMDMAVIQSLMRQPKLAIESLHCDREMMAKYPQLLLLKSDMLCNCGQYDAAYRLLIDIDQTSEKLLEANDELFNQSPLLYTFDFSMKGYLYRLGQVSRATGRISAAQSNLVNALMLDQNDIKLRKAVVEAFMIGLKFDEAMMYANETTHDEKKNDPLGQDQLDLSITKIEILINLDEKDEAKDLLNDLSQKGLAYSRYLASQSLLAANYHDFDLAKEYLDEAMQSYQDSFKETKILTLEDMYQQVANLSAIALAAHSINEDDQATQFHQKAIDKLNNQPLFNLRYAQTLLSGAENQSIAETLSIVNHSPGKSFLSQSTKGVYENLLEKLSDFLTPEKMMCLKARGIAAFTGSWPLSLNADSCIIGPEEASAILLSTDDERLAQDIIASYPQDIKVLQAYGIHQLRFNPTGDVTFIEKALSIEPCNPICHAILAQLNKDDPENAIKSIETALEFWPNEPGWHAIAADLYTQIVHT